jgi:hypothetical protein
MNYHLRAMGEPPMPPADADFAFTINFQKGSGNPRRVFDASSALIEAFEILDKALVESIDVSIAPLMVLEDVEGGSIKVFLKNILSRIDDEALKTADWKMLVGHYLVKAKYIVLEYCDKKDGAPSLLDLREGLRRLAQETDVRHLPDYAPVNEGRLITAMDQIQRAKGNLDLSDRLTIESEDRIYEVDISSQWQPSDVVIPDDTTTSTSFGQIILTIRKPDFIKDTMWQFSHGRITINAPIRDANWLSRFHQRLIPIAPGDALRCSVTFTYTYDTNGTLIGQKIEIDKVLAVIRTHSGSQGDLLRD